MRVMSLRGRPTKSQRKIFIERLSHVAYKINVGQSQCLYISCRKVHTKEKSGLLKIEVFELLKVFF